MNMKTVNLGLLVVGLLAGPMTAQAVPIYRGSGSAAGEYSEDILIFDPSEPSGQSVGATCRQSYSFDFQNIVADLGRPSVDLWITGSLVSTYLAGPRPDTCVGGTSQQPFAFRNVEVTDLGLSGSNSNGDFTFDWTFNADRTLLAGPISLRDGRVPGYASLELAASVPEPGTFTLLWLGLAGMTVALRRRTTSSMQLARGQIA